jgi:hypothetical protein
MSYGYASYGYGTAYASRRSAPPSVHGVAILQYLAGFVLLLAAGLITLVSVAGDRWTADLPDSARNMIAGTGLAIAAFLGFAGLFTVVVGRKLQRGRQWARILVMVLSALSLAGTLYNGLLLSRDTNVLVGLVFPVLYLILLNTRAARSWFRARTY